MYPLLNGRLPGRWILFLATFFVVAGCSTAGKDISLDAVAYTGLSIMQGYTTPTATQISVVVPKDKSFRYFVRGESDESEIDLREIAIERQTHGGSNWAVDVLFISGLKPGKTFRLEVRDAVDTLLDSREFSSLRLDGDSIRILAASCMSDSFHDVQSRIWPEALRREPDVIFLLGDNVYAVPPKSKHVQVKPADLWRRYVETRLTLELYRHPKLIPVMAIWDDNDYGMPDGDRRYGYKSQSAEIMRAFFPAEPDMRHMWNGPGISMVWRARGHRFIFLDNRTFRSPNNLGGDDETHWGRAQKRWLFEELAAGGSPTWVMNGDQIFGGYHKFESFQGNHPRDFKDTLQAFARVRSPFAFLTGDRHNTEVMRVQLNKPLIRTFELTSSPIHGKTYPPPWTETPNPFQIVGRAEVPNYMIIESSNVAGDMRIRLTSYTVGDQILFNEALWLSRDGRRLKVY